MAEVIDFFWPNEIGKSIYVTNIKDNVNDEDTLKNNLAEIFSDCGLVCEVKIGKYVPLVYSESAETSNNTENAFMYALIKFYMRSSVLKALAEPHYYGEDLLKVKLSTKKLLSQCTPLYYKKCIEVANYFLSFSGWSSKVEKYVTDYDDERQQVTVTCYVRLCVKLGSVNSLGKSIVLEKFTNEVKESKLCAFIKAKNQAFKLAMENAFIKLFIVKCDSGKVYVYCNENKEDEEEMESDYEGETLLKVNHYDEYVDEEEVLDEVLQADVCNNDQQ